MLNRSLILGLLLTAPFLQAQSSFAPSAPLDIPLVLSGTFAELRGNHFHGGIDIKTQGRSGLRIDAVADGYVSRVAVKPIRVRKCTLSAASRRLYHRLRPLKCLLSGIGTMGGRPTARPQQERRQPLPFARAVQGHPWPTSRFQRQHRRLFRSAPAL